MKCDVEIIEDMKSKKNASKSDKIKKLRRLEKHALK